MSDQNPFDVLGNDVEDANVVAPLPPKELVKKNTSSKKADVPPPSADPSRANKNRPKPSGNEGAFRDKSNGRRVNKGKDAPESTAAKTSHAARRATDRQNRSGKVDTEKRVRQGWGDDRAELAAEAEGEADAQAELKDDQSAEKTSVSNKKSLQDYLNEQANNELNKAPITKKNVENLEAELLVKREEVYAEPTKVKAVKNKQQKSKQYLDFDATFADSKPKPRSFENKAPRRGGKPKNTRGAPKAADKKPVVNAENFPSLA
ncbi:LAMI_0H17744g1_1 [Lachancea mirantina]|uniref:LAMI_0H17744g1_1 n=1 Tax=Lachancea mirantina TaxID=1230905 RepID=A0A1G4KJA5_9SACH|nr:LAMI_0H17744g1_1 [Lachancea mirantina]